MGFSIPPPGVPRDVLLALQSFKELKDWLVSFEDCRPSWALSSFLGHRGDPGSDTLWQHPVALTDRANLEPSDERRNPNSAKKNSPGSTFI